MANTDIYRKKTWLKCFMISCSSDSELNVPSLFLWGESQFQGGLPDTEKEARKRIEKCRMKNNCKFCDAEIHLVHIERTKQTYAERIRDTQSPYKDTKT